MDINKKRKIIAWSMFGFIIIESIPEFFIDRYFMSIFYYITYNCVLGFLGLVWLLIELMEFRGFRTKKRTEKLRILFLIVLMLFIVVMAVLNLFKY
jgi:hypothetical protein